MGFEYQGLTLEAWNFNTMVIRGSSSNFSENGGQKDPMADKWDWFSEE